jgi:hypothetical protein
MCHNDKKGDIMKTKMSLMLVFLMLVSVFPGRAGQDKIPGQRPMLLIDNTFQFITGSWADYTYFDKQKNESNRIYFAILERENIKGVPYFWMEIEADMQDGTSAVTKVLVEEIKNGIGKIDRAIVQVKGYTAFEVPKKYLEGQDQQVGQFQPAHILKRLEQKTIQHKGKTIDIITAEAETDKGETISVTISLNLPPITIYKAEGKDFRMTVNDWGMGAQTKIIGEPESFFMWILDQVASGLAKSDEPTTEKFSVSIRPAQQAVNSGEKAITTASVTGGLPPYSYEWFDDNKKFPEIIKERANWTLRGAGTRDIKVVVTDSAGNKAEAHAQIVVRADK